MLAKFRCLEIVAMETTTNSLFSLMTNISARGLGIVLKFWQCVLLDQRYILCLQHNFMRVTDFVIIKQSSRQGHVDVKFHMGH